MASYPTAVKTFTTKNAGDTIQPADVNDLQNEVNAIEAGLLNGTANLNSSNSTVANLSVSGGSTLVSLRLTGASSATVIPVPYARFTNSVKTDVPNNTLTMVSWDTTDVDPGSLHSTSVNSSRVNLTSSGAWLVGASLRWNPLSSGTRLARLLANDTTCFAEASTPASAGSEGIASHISGLYYATSTSQYVGVQVFQNSGSTGSIGGHSTGVNQVTALWLTRVSG